MRLRVVVSYSSMLAISDLLSIAITVRKGKGRHDTIALSLTATSSSYKT